MYIQVKIEDQLNGNEMLIADSACGLHYFFQ